MSVERRVQRRAFRVCVCMSHQSLNGVVCHSFYRNLTRMRRISVYFYHCTVLLWHYISYIVSLSSFNRRSCRWECARHPRCALSTPPRVTHDRRGLGTWEKGTSRRCSQPHSESRAVVSRLFVNILLMVTIWSVSKTKVMDLNLPRR